MTHEGYLSPVLMFGRTTIKTSSLTFASAVSDQIETTILQVRRCTSNLNPRISSTAHFEGYIGHDGCLLLIRHE